MKCHNLHIDTSVIFICLTIYLFICLFVYILVLTMGVRRKNCRGGGGGINVILNSTCEV